MKGIVLCDICWTLYKSNTTFDFLDYYFKSKSYVFTRRISKTILFRVVNKISVCVFDYDLIRAFFVRRLNGISKSDLLKMGNEFYNSYLSGKEIYESIDIISRFKEKGYKIVLASATLDFIAEIIASNLNIPDYFGTNLQYDKNGICKGKIYQDRLGNKERAMRDLYNLKHWNVVITDNITDIDIIRKCNRVFILPFNRIERWKSLLKKNDVKNIEYLIIK